MADAAHGLGFDLPDTLPGHAQDVADLLERHLLHEAHGQHAYLLRLAKLKKAVGQCPGVALVHGVGLVWAVRDLFA